MGSDKGDFPKSKTLSLLGLPLTLYDEEGVSCLIKEFATLEGGSLHFSPGERLKRCR